MHKRATSAFDEFVLVATGFTPYEYQRRMAIDGPPEVLEVPTGAGKTLAATLPWLYRRRFHPDPAVRHATPRRLVLVLPMRVLVEQTVDNVRTWLANVGAPGRGFDVSGIQVEVVMGGERQADDDWRLRPDADTVLIGTLDMLLSRALNRGYAQSRYVWPVDFGLLSTDCQWVFDEIQLMGPALPTSRQLHALRNAFGTAAPCTSMWMSATVDRDSLSTVDNPNIATVTGISAQDKQGPLSKRLDAPKRVEELALPEGKNRQGRLADALLARHRPGTLTLAMLNNVQRAQDLHAALVKQTPEVPIVLLHSRFRPSDRRRQVDLAVSEPVDPLGPGRVVVATQVLEAGVDVSAATLLTEAASWPSLVQRGGRCNRYGEISDARLLWVSPPRPEPYSPEDVEVAVAALRRLEGADVTPRSLQAEPVELRQVDHPMLRRRDLVELFDTAPDLAGDDLDVSRFLRETDDVDVQVAWRDDFAQAARGHPPVPTRDELCAVPVGQLRDWLRKPGVRAWRLDHLEDRWERISEPAVQLRPGHVVIVEAGAGGYLPDRGWDPSSRAPVEVPEPEEPSPLAGADEAVQADPLTYSRRWQPLVEHLADVEREVRTLTAALGLDSVARGYLEAAAAAGRFHDVGKAHTVFQDTLAGTADGEAEQPDEPGPWAKSGGSLRPRHDRKHFRHELVSALALLGAGAPLLDAVAEPDLVRYLVAAHHGRVRLAIRSLPGESPHPDGPQRRVALGIHDGEHLQAVQVPAGMVPAGALDLSVMEMGAGSDGRASWTARTLALRDRADLGPFRLAMLEALVRVADWRASRALGNGQAR